MTWLLVIVMAAQGEPPRVAVTVAGFPDPQLCQRAAHVLRPALAKKYHAVVTMSCAREIRYGET